MFQEALDFSLSFIGIHLGDEGCTLAALGEFLDKDVFPFCGWQANRSLRDSVIKLLLNEYSSEVTLFLYNPETFNSSVPLVSKQKKETPDSHSNSETLNMSSDKDYNDKKTPNMGSGMVLRKSMTPSELSHILDEKPILWEDTSPRSISHRVRICPSHELREKVFGIPIRTSTARQTVDYVSENALCGCGKVLVKTKLPAKYKQYILTTGIARMCRNQMLSMYYLMDRTTREVTCRYFPWYAAPLTELEKKEVSTTSAQHSLNKENWTPGSNRTPQQLTHQRSIKGNQPINHYFWRLRQTNLQYYVFDLKTIKHVVRASPEKKLLYQDAIHTIFMLHGLNPYRPSEFTRANRMRLRRMLLEAGLRIVVVTIPVRDRLREVSIVIPEEDFYNLSRSSMSAVKKVKLEENEIISSISYKLKEENDDDDDDGDAMVPEEEALNETADGLRQMQHNSRENDAGGESDTSSDSISASASDDENSPTLKTGGKHPNKGDLQKMNLTLKRSEAATSPLYISADWPFDLQFAKEAERRPISLMAAYPRMVFYPNEKLRIKGLSLYMTNYLKRGTLETYYTLTARSKSFTLVYAPKAKPSNKVVDAGHEGEPTQATPLPPGTSQYAIDVVLDALKASPHKALAIRDLTNIIDNKALQQRVIPYLRSTNRITTTGITLKNKERVGIVVLVGTTLTEDEKHAVSEASREATHHTVVPGEITLPSVAQAKRRQLKLDMSLPNIPATVDGVEKSEAHMNLSNPSFRTAAVARKIMTIRNGYARSTFYRAGRLHLELWKQWYDAIHQGDCCSAEGTTTYSMGVQDIYDNMSLSTFCIVIGFAGLDLATVLVDHRGHNAHSTSGGVSWATPLRLLPPSVKEICQEQGVQPLLHGLSVLQRYGLIRSDEVLDCFVTKSLQDIKIALECYATDSVRSNTIILHDNTRYTPSMTMCAVLRYWLPIWCRSVKHAVIIHMSELYEAEPNPTIETLVALNRRLRFNVCILAESFYQNCGINRLPPSNVLSQQHQNNAKTQHSSKLSQYGSHGRRRPSRQAAFLRRDTSGITLARELRTVFTSSLPHKRLRSILYFLRRLSRAHFSVIPTGLPSLRDALLTSLQRHAFSSNPYTNFSTLHLCVLGEALQHVLQSYMPHNDSISGNALSSLTRSLHRCIDVVFSPNATFSPMGSLEDSPCTQRYWMPEDLDLSCANTPPPLELTEASDYEEVMLDSLRMILLSDAAHYSSVIAKELVLAFPSKLVALGRNYLQKEPSFSQASWKRSHRIPDLALSARPCLFTPHLTRPAPRPCANTALIHGWVSNLHDTINNVATGTTTPEFQPRFTCSSLPNSHFDVLVASQPVMDVKEIPLLAREDDVMSTLRIPTLIWPTAARVLEEGVRNTRPVILKKGVKQRQKRQHEEYDEADSNIINKDIIGKFAEDEENDINADLPTQSFANDLDVAASATLYPARTLVRYNEEYIDLADRIPTDPEPTTEEADMVKKNIARIAEAKGKLQGSLSLGVGGSKSEAAYPLAYPSVFHHVDGALHVFVWKLFLLSIYRYVLHVPGVLYTTLRKRAMVSGLISRRALNAALQFLVDSTVLVRKNVRTVVGGVEDCYTTTTLQEGLWDIINLS